MSKRSDDLPHCCNPESAIFCIWTKPPSLPLTICLSMPDKKTPAIYKFVPPVSLLYKTYRAAIFFDLWWHPLPDPWRISDPYFRYCRHLALQIPLLCTVRSPFTAVHNTPAFTLSANTAHLWIRSRHHLRERVKCSVCPPLIISLKASKRLG